MKRHNLEFEKLIISKAVGLAFHRFNFVIGTFQRAG
jgi:hypothetical protein